ncbi:flagellar basal body-associated FliL family protein [Bythopirellula goksoeyrii]|uniref:Flagellar protein FliL n=1 Tax=Bythopirellula goksoeyrii TaxID=1400387 RepID=A0A5B9Q250_9BACT|nr:flagellar basal body-associated FliL family protein [Bythopirellula goksoeyrii]QEG33044.1 hypothetical protein Pr1d_03050 [Bythopirellula goksoeyrii]
MSETPIVDESVNVEPSGSKKTGIMTLVKAFAVLSVLVLLQVIGVSMLLPTSAETSQIAEQLVAAENSAESEDGSSAASSNEPVLGATYNMREVSLGTFHVVTYDADTGSSLNVDFDLFGTVLATEEGEFLQLYTDNERRLREQILVTVRGANVTDLSDPDLDLIKRKILEKTNRTLGKPLIQEAIFSKFSFIER